MERVIPHGADPVSAVGGAPYYMGRFQQTMLARDRDTAPLTYSATVLPHSFLHNIIFERDRSLAGGVPKSPRSFPHLSIVADELANIASYEIWGPDSIRRPSPIRSRRIAATGGNLHSFLYRLKAEDPDSLRQIVSEMASPYPWLSSIEFDIGPGLHGDVVSCRFLEHQKTSTKRSKKSKNQQYTAHQVSDGFLRLLAITAIKFNRESTIVLYEEPENGLHPSAIGYAAKQLRQIAASGVQVIATTHSPLFVSAAFAESTPSDVQRELHLVERDQSGETFMRRPKLGVLANSLRSHIAIGDLWASLIEESSLAEQ